MKLRYQIRSIKRIVPDDPEHPELGYHGEDDPTHLDAEITKDDALQYLDLCKLSYVKAINTLSPITPTIREEMRFWTKYLAKHWLEPEAENLCQKQDQAGTQK
jgi:hypothetical protein